MLQQLPAPPINARVLSGFENRDDAGVYLVRPDLALVHTIDFFTPIVDDPETYGAIAAANALSDIYAMGGEPLTALAVTAFPAARLSSNILVDILVGGRRVMDRAGVAVLGGHSVEDDEPKMGYAVMGTVHPDAVWHNHTGRPGQWLYLTKAIGTGVLQKAHKDRRAQEAWLEAASQMMLETNRAAAQCLRDAVGAPGAVTDVTGYGLLGHAWEMAAGASLTIVLSVTDVPILSGALEMAHDDRFPAGSRKNWTYVAPHVTTAHPGIPPAMQMLLADAVTSGGLLFLVDPHEAPRLEQEAAEHHVRVHRIGYTEEGPAQIILQ